MRSMCKQVSWQRSWWLGGLLVLGSALLPGCASVPAPPAAVVDAGHADLGTARMQVHRVWRFVEDGVRFSNRLVGARANAVKRLGPDRYALLSTPESLPINPSPWYGFVVTARQPTTVRIEFRYRHGRQRYWPKLSHDGVHWRRADEADFAKAEDDHAVLTLRVDSKPLQVFAQPPIGPADFADWEEDLRARPWVHTGVIGHSVQGRPLRLLRFGNPDAKRVLLVLGRQHPPETTGSRALMQFVSRLAGKTPLARKFRARMQVWVVPLMNPDGVVEGNWRGNANGKDLNRDWGTFTEPETQAVRAMLHRHLDAAGRHLAFAIDFHSTWHDIFYTVRESPARRPGGTLRRWIDAMRAQFPGQIREKANAAKGTVFKNWVYREYGAPSVTYEVGDASGAAGIDAKAVFGADRLMRILLDEPARQEQHVGTG